MDSLSKIMVTGPEQDCSGAIAVCSQTYGKYQTLTFNHLTTFGLSANTTTVCNSGTSLTLTVTGANTEVTYTLNPGEHPIQPE